MKAPQNILVPIDFSTSSERALEHAKAFATPFGATVHLLHVVIDAASQAWSVEAVGLNVPELVKGWREEADRRLGALDTGGLATERATVVGQPFVDIIKYAREHDIDLIVMGTHGRGAIEHMLLGSVAEKVVRKAPCPVMTVRDPAHTFTRP